MLTLRHFGRVEVIACMLVCTIIKVSCLQVQSVSMLCQPWPDTEHIENQSSLYVKQSVLHVVLQDEWTKVSFFHSSVCLSAQ